MELPPTACNRGNPADRGEVSTARSTCPVWPVVCCWYSAYCRHPSLTWLPAPNQVVCPDLTDGAVQYSAVNSTAAQMASQEEQEEDLHSHLQVLYTTQEQVIVLCDYRTRW